MKTGTFKTHKQTKQFWLAVQIICDHHGKSQSKMQKAVGFNKGNLDRELHQLADGKLNSYTVNLKKTRLLLQQLQTLSEQRGRNYVYPLTMLVCYRPFYQCQHEERQTNNTAEIKFISKQALYIGNVKKRQLIHFLRNESKAKILSDSEQPQCRNSK